MMEYRRQFLFPEHIQERGLDYYGKEHLGKLYCGENLKIQVS